MASVDIAIPNYQYGRFLRTCVHSILTQNIAELRVLIIDNASTDDSLEVAQQLGREDARVQLVAHRRNMGPHASFNEGIDWARADYFLILCADDFLAPNALARAVGVMERHPGVGLTYGRVHCLIADGPALVEAASPEFWDVQPGAVVLRRFCATGICPIVGCTALVRTAVQQQAGYYRPALPHTDDFELWMRFAALADVARTEAVQGVVRIHDMAQSRSVREQLLRDILICEAAFESFFAHEGAELASGRRLHRMARRSLAARAYWSGLSHLCRGHTANGRGLLRYAYCTRPAAVLMPPIGYLLRRKDMLSRSRWVLSEMLKRARGAPPTSEWGMSA